MKTTKGTTYEVSLYIGGSYKNGPFTHVYSESKLIDAIKKYQMDNKEKYQLDKICNCIPVRITKTHFVYGTGSENGWEVTAISYPRCPRPHEQIVEFVTEMTKYLLKEFKQERISIISPEETIMIEK